MREAEAEETGEKIGLDEQQQQEDQGQHMETDDVEVPEVVPVATEHVSGVSTSFCCHIVLDMYTEAVHAGHYKITATPRRNPYDRD